jgi:hypothetical protein
MEVFIVTEHAHQKMRIAAQGARNSAVRPEGERGGLRRLLLVLAVTLVVVNTLWNRIDDKFAANMQGMNVGMAALEARISDIEREIPAIRATADKIAAFEARLDENAHVEALRQDFRRREAENQRQYLQQLEELIARQEAMISPK